MRINGGPPQLGEWLMQGPKDMTLASEPIIGLTGEKVVPWNFPVVFNINECPKRIDYKYSIQCEHGQVWEREPTRHLEILDPKTYDGDGNFWKNSDSGHIVNGHIEKHDANFVGGLTFDKIGETGLFIGPYPQSEEDTETLKTAGVSGIFNVQSHVDIEHRGVNWSNMLEYYSSRDMKAIHFPIKDFNEEELVAHLFEGACQLNQMICEGHKVYVHCTAGMGRAPAIVLAYLCLFKKVDNWWDPSAVDKMVKSFRTVSAPNLGAVYRVVEMNK